MKALKLFMPLIEDWCNEVGTEHFVLTVMPDQVIIASLTKEGVKTHTFSNVNTTKQ